MLRFEVHFADEETGGAAAGAPVQVIELETPAAPGEVIELVDVTVPEGAEEGTELLLITPDG
eukprot:COSAG01_NODE_3086_length_6611_cov_12.899109_9_plen_61_part_01